MELPDIPTEENIEKAANLFRRYYLVPDPKTGLLGTGSQFDDWAADQALQHPNEITDSDLVAVSLPYRHSDREGRHRTPGSQGRHHPATR